jgi:uncharacterized phage protein gp47/JayE
MSFARPTLPELVDRIEGDFLSKVTGVAAILRRAMVRVLSRVFAGAAHMMHGHLAYLGDQPFPDKSDDDFLLRQASLFGLSLNPPVPWRGTAGITGTNGNTAPATSKLTSAAGFEYTVDADVTISAGVGTIAVTAVLAGADAELAPGDTLTFESPIAGINASATVASVTQDGTDQETIDSLRQRVLARMQDPPEGGSDADYHEWCAEVSGVTRSWIKDLGLGPGTVLIYFVRDGDGSGTAIIPDSGEVAAVQAVINEKKPAHATVTVAAPAAVALPVTFSALNPNTVAVKNAITAQINDFIQRVAEPGTTVYLSELRTAIGQAEGLVDYTMTAPSGNVTHAANEIAIPGTITFP